VKPAIEFQRLRDLAIAGDEQAAQMLFLFAFDAAQCLKEVALKNPKPLLSLTRKSPFFPAMICPNNSQDHEHSELLKLCEVGKDSTFNSVSTSAMKFETPAKITAFTFYRAMLSFRDGAPVPTDESGRAIAEACKALPKPSRENFKQWNDVLMQWLPGVDRIAEYPNEWDRIVSKDSTPGQKVDAIKKAISQAFKTILPDS
jgi:hypothetical protein